MHTCFPHIVAFSLQLCIVAVLTVGWVVLFAMTTVAVGYSGTWESQWSGASVEVLMTKLKSAMELQG